MRSTVTMILALVLASGGIGGASTLGPQQILNRLQQSYDPSAQLYCLCQAAR